MIRSSRLLLLVVALAACDGDDAKSSIKVASTEGPRPADDLAIATRDGGMLLAVRHDTIRMRLSDSARRVAQSEMAKATQDTSGGAIGSWIKEKALGLVAEGMKIEMSVPVAGIKSLTREDSSIHFEMRDGKSGFSFGSKGKSKGNVGPFSPSDADKFIAYVGPKLAK